MRTCTELRYWIVRHAVIYCLISFRTPCTCLSDLHCECQLQVSNKAVYSSQISARRPSLLLVGVALELLLRVLACLLSIVKSVAFSVYVVMELCRCCHRLRQRPWQLTSYGVSLRAVRYDRQNFLQSIPFCHSAGGSKVAPSSLAREGQ